MKTNNMGITTLFEIATEANAGRAIGAITGDVNSLSRTNIVPLGIAAVSVATLIVTALVTGSRDTDMKESETSGIVAINVVAVILMMIALVVFLRTLGRRAASRFRGIRVDL